MILMVILIALEITPIYSYPINDPEDHRNIIFPMKTGSRTINHVSKRTIPKKIAQQWLDQARNILNTIEENMKRERTMFENSGREKYL